MSSGQSLKLFFIDGKQDGMLTAEIFNWTGHVLVAPRTQIVQALARHESTYTGVYLLLGERDDEEYVYVGESENISERIRMHDLQKDWWTRVIFVVARANNLNKAHAKYLEARLVEEAKAVGSIKLDNANMPSCPSLSEADVADMESFLDYLLMVLPAVRVDSFVQKKRSAAPAMEAKAISVPQFELAVIATGVKATAILEDGEFIVQAGSTARKSSLDGVSHNSGYRKLFEKLIEKGVLVDCADHWQFSADYKFSSTSAAGAIVTGRATAGPREWKLIGSSKTYRDWENEMVAKVNSR